MIALQVERNPDKLRYELTFNQGNAEWFMFLNDEVLRDSLRFSEWLKRLVQAVQEKERL